MNRSEIAQALDEHRREIGMTKQELALRCQMDVSNIVKITHGAAYRIDTLLVILDVLGLEINIQKK